MEEDNYFWSCFARGAAADFAQYAALAEGDEREWCRNMAAAAQVNAAFTPKKVRYANPRRAPGVSFRSDCPTRPWQVAHKVDEKWVAIGRYATEAEAVAVALEVNGAR